MTEIKYYKGTIRLAITTKPPSLPLPLWYDEALSNCLTFILISYHCCSWSSTNWWRSGVIKTVCIRLDWTHLMDRTTPSSGRAISSRGLSGMKISLASTGCSDSISTQICCKQKHRYFIIIRNISDQGWERVFEP